MEKIGAILPAQSHRLMRDLVGAIAVSTFGWKDYSRSRETIDKLTKALLHRYTVRLQHTAAGHEKPVPREVNPYKLWYANNGLYLVGMDHRSNDLRVFAVDRIASVSPDQPPIQDSFRLRLRQILGISIQDDRRNGSRRAD
jgi:predicted DNA-binding transcriptional regulator YafY